MKWAGLILILLVFGFALKLSLLVYAMYVLLGVMLLSRFFSRQWADNLVAYRSCPATSAEITESVRVTVVVENRRQLRIPWVLLEDWIPLSVLRQVPQRIKTSGVRKAIHRIDPGGEQRLEYTVTFLMRGYYQFGPLLMETGDLFGLHRRFRVATEPHYVLVPPRIVPLRGYAIASRRPVGEIRIAHRLFEDPTRIAAVRPFQPGDPLNRIHWRATARTGELHSRVYENSCVAGATLVLDFHLASYSKPADIASSELAIVAVASLANAVYEMGRQIGFVSNGRDAAERIRTEGWDQEFRTRDDARKRVMRSEKNDSIRPVVVETRKGADQIHRILEVLARLEISAGIPFRELLIEGRHELPRDATVIAILRRVTEADAIALGALKRGGYRVAVALIQFDDAPHFSWAQAPVWAAPLVAEGIDVIRVQDEGSLADLNAAQLVG